MVGRNGGGGEMAGGKRVLGVQGNSNSRLEEEKKRKGKQSKRQKEGGWGGGGGGKKERQKGKKEVTKKKEEEKKDFVYDALSLTELTWDHKEGLRHRSQTWVMARMPWRSSERNWVNRITSLLPCDRAAAGFFFLVVLLSAIELKTQVSCSC